MEKSKLELNKSFIKSKNELKREKKEEFKKVLETEIDDEIEDVIIGSENYFEKMFYSFLMALVSLVIIVLLDNDIIKLPDAVENNIYEHIIIFILYYVAAFSVISIIYLLFLFMFAFFEINNFLKFIFERNPLLIKIASSIIIIYAYNILIDLEKESKKYKGLELTIVNIYLSTVDFCTYISIVLLLKSIFINITNFFIFKNHFSKRITENEQIISFFQSMNQFGGKKISSSMKKWASHIFNSLTQTREYLVVADFYKFFGKENGDYLFSIFDINKDNKIEMNEFVMTYVRVFKERVELRRALERNAVNIQKLDNIVSFCCFPIYLFILLAISNRDVENAKLRFGALSGIFFSLSFAFKGLISDVFNSIVFIYYVRPFEVGDIIGYDDKIFKVKKIGLLFTDLQTERGLITTNNLKLKNKLIENYRTIDCKKATFTKKCNLKTIINKIDDLKENIRKFLRGNDTTYKPELSIDQLELEKDTLEITIEIYIIVQLMNRREITKGVDGFTIFLYELFKKLKIEEKT